MVPRPVDPSSVLARLPVDAGVAVLRDGDRTFVCAAPAEVRVASGGGAFAALDSIERDGGFWAGFLSYDLGRSVERIIPSTTDDLGLPDLAFARFAARLVLTPGAPPAVEGDGPGRKMLERAVWQARGAGQRSVPPPPHARWRRRHAEAGWSQRVDAVLDLLAAGECYQVNLTRRLTVDEAADPFALFAALARDNPAPHACLVAFGVDSPIDAAIVSASPERFLSVNGREVETRPIKGTDSDAARLAASAKDHAENVMIVDLARNDLGRVCEHGSVRTHAIFELEAHPGLFHLVSTVRGRLRSEVGISELVRATFPPASVTGAPKPRVLQAIEDLEPLRRGVYCGAVGWIDSDLCRADLAVAIRTFTITHGATHLGVGGGIVADSDPAAEWRETQLKAARLLEAAGRGASPGRKVGAARAALPRRRAGS